MLYLATLLRSVVLCVSVSLSVLLDALVATTANADSDRTSNQPRCGW